MEEMDHASIFLTVLRVAMAVPIYVMLTMEKLAVRILFSLRALLASAAME